MKKIERLRRKYLNTECEFCKEKIIIVQMKSQLFLELTCANGHRYSIKTCMD